MYLRRLEMKGFKSFADKTVVDFENGISCVVGPNGSGKSNITDAVRWVLGEQRAKTLRGSKMEDIIFSGTKHRKPLGFAEVSLFFDNDNNYFPLDFSEVVITRKVFRSGESEYYINNTPCRLKDVREMFHDTGIGTDGYSIIGQGRIERVLSNNKDERRQIFEEAAGIVKYKSRKKEAERKLENTDANLLRVDDIINELEVRIEPLKGESEKAQEYLTLKEQLKEIELNIFIKDYERLEKRLKTEDEKMAGNAADIEAKETEFKKNNQKVEDLYREINTISGNINSHQERFYSISNEIKKLEGEKELHGERIQNLDENCVRIRGEIDEIGRLKAIASEEVATLQESKSGVDESISKCRAFIEEKNQEYQDILEELEKAEGKTESGRRKIIDLLSAIERYKSDVSGFENIMENFNSRKTTIDTDMATYDENIERLNDTILELELKKTELDHMLMEHESLKRDQMGQLDFLKGENRTLEDSKQTMSHKLTELNSERNLLVRMENEFDGFNHSVKNVLKLCSENHAFSKGVHGVAASLIDTDPKYESAIEVAMGKALQNVVCDSEKDAKKIIEHLKKNKLGRVTFLPMSNLKSKGDNKDNMTKLKNVEGFIGKANELIRYDEQYSTLFDYLLGRIIIAEDFDSAVKMLRIPNLKYKIITLEGEVLIPGGAITGGSFKSKISNILGRKRRILELQDLISETEHSIKRQEETLLGNMLEIGKLEKRITGINEEIDTHKIDIVKVVGELKVFMNEMDNATESKRKLSSELAMLMDQIKTTEENVTERKANIEKLTEEKMALEEEINENTSDIKAIEVKVNSIKERLTEEKVQEAAQLEKLESITKELNRLEGSLNNSEQEIASKTAQIELMVEQKNQLENSVKDAAEKIVAFGEELERLTTSKAALESERTGKNRLIVGLRESSEKLKALIDEAKEIIHKSEVSIAKFSVEKENIIRDIWERYEMSLFEAMEYKKENEIPNATKRIREIKNRLKDIGEVSIASIKEYKEVSERYGFLSEQKEDLIKSQKSLQKVIRDLEKTMKEQFLEHYKIIREHFREIFRELFIGGTSDLILTDEENILECDIEIVAQPPGKKLQDINLLSGGEKSLTAISLLFAILKTKPAPFCILDEIEAALDDVNVFRFAEFISYFTKKSQFIVITHRKGTMEIADILYGVTMEEYGVSKIVSVKLDEVQ